MPWSRAPAARAAEAGKLLVWINGDKGYNGLQKVGDKFAEKSGVQVTVEHPEDAPGKFQQAAAAGKGPDIWCWPHDRIGEWIQGGLIVPVTPGKAMKDAIDPKAWQAFTVGGKLWGYPLSEEAIGLIYNKDLVPTPPKTFDDVDEARQAALRQGARRRSSGTTTTPTSPGRCWPPTAATCSARRPTATSTRPRSA